MRMTVWELQVMLNKLPGEWVVDILVKPDGSQIALVADHPNHEGENVAILMVANVGDHAKFVKNETH